MHIDAENIARTAEACHDQVAVAVAVNIRRRTVYGMSTNGGTMVTFFLAGHTIICTKMFVQRIESGLLHSVFVNITVQYFIRIVFIVSAKVFHVNVGREHEVRTHSVICGDIGRNRAHAHGAGSQFIVNAFGTAVNILTFAVRGRSQRRAAGERVAARGQHPEGVNTAVVDCIAQDRLLEPGHAHEAVVGQVGRRVVDALLQPVKRTESAVLPGVSAGPGLRGRAVRRKTYEKYRQDQYQIQNNVPARLKTELHAAFLLFAA